MIRFSLLRNTLASVLFGMTALLGGAAHAATIQVAGSAPVLTQLIGQQSDTGTPTLSLTTASFSGFVSRVDWWGYDLLQPLGGSTDDFVLMLGGQTLAGTLTRNVAATVSDAQLGDVQLFRYSLVLSGLEFFDGPQELGLSNQSFDAEWYWQGSSTLAPTLAYAIFVDRDDDPDQVPEPGALALALAALLGAGLVRRR
jgi:MYXO-CTERM domain-containing protein